MKKIPFGFNFHKEKIFPTHNIREFAEIIFDLGCRAIELAYLHVDISRDEIIEAKYILNKFDFVTIHTSLENLPLMKSLEQINTIKNLINIKSTVFHPDKIDDWSLLDKFINPALENMDYRHDKYTNLNEMQKLATQYNCKIVVNLAHLFSVENDIKKWRISSSLANKISHFHISNPDIYEVGKYLHKPIIKGNRDIIEFALQFNKPIIIEPLPETLEGLKDSVKIMRDVIR